jgi:Uri superfamily endonuclease
MAIQKAIPLGYFQGGSECDFANINSALPVPIGGFGSTDGKRCRSHLLGPTCMDLLRCQDLVE